MFNKSIILLAVMAVMTVFPVYAMNATDGQVIEGDDSGATWSVRPSISSLNGEAHEIVYVNLPDGRKWKLSELIWDLTAIDMIGAIGSVNVLHPRLQFNLGLWGSATEGTGEMYDYDWMMDTREWSHRSRSEVDASIFMMDLNGTVKIVDLPDVGPFSQVSLRGVLGYKMQTFEWDDRGYEYTYTVNSFRDTIGTFGGENVIDYEQKYSLLYFGLSGRATVGPVDINSYLLFSNMVDGEDTDHHILRDTIFKASMDGGEYVSIGVEGTYAITDMFYAGVGLHYQDFAEFEGSTVQNGEPTDAIEAISLTSTMFTVSGGVNF